MTTTITTTTTNKDDNTSTPPTSSSSWAKIHWLEDDIELTFLSAEMGMGMFTQAYLIFAVGLLNPVWEVLYPTCYNHIPDDGCVDAAVNAITYVEMAGVIMGMLIFGVIATVWGHVRGAQGTAALMSAGSIVMCAAYITPLTIQFAIFNLGMFVVGLGMGGEYPVASSRAAEHAENAENTTQKLHTAKTGRGLSMLLIFTMQGWGTFINVVVVIVLLLLTGTSECVIPGHGNSTNITECSKEGLEITWRLTYALILVIVIPLLMFRLFRTKPMLPRQSSFKLSAAGHPTQHSRWYIFFHTEYVWRLCASSFCWFLWNVVFYSNQLFLATITAVLVPSGQLLETQQFALINAAVGLVGYYAAALLIDRPWIGRMRMQAMGFLIVGSLYLGCAYNYTYLSSSEGVRTFQALYFLASFFAELGPNATTWLVPGELFPTDIRPECHGISAASGKVGALIAALIFTFGGPGNSKVSASVIFVGCGWCAIIGSLISIVLVPDTGTVSLTDVDHRWKTLRGGKEYHGKCVEPHALSWFEVLVKPPPVICPLLLEDGGGDL